MINTGMLDLVGNTPVVRMNPIGESELSRIDLFAKLEYYNPTGSIKDRPAAFIIRHLLINQKIHRGSEVIESSSGNFGIALAAICKSEGIRFTCVIDPMIQSHNEFLLRQYGANIIKVNKKDESGGYLKSRIEMIQEILDENTSSIWLNQYANDKNAMAHYYGTGMEIYKTFADVGLDFVFVAVSSGGTICGVSRLLKEQFPKIRVIAVDTVGSVIFSNISGQRLISGMGASIRPELVGKAYIDHVVHVKETEIIDGCMQILQNHGHFVGGSSGAVYVAARKFFAVGNIQVGDQNYPRLRGKPKVLLLFPDRGERYSATIYNKEWVSNHFASEAPTRASQTTVSLS